MLILILLISCCLVHLHPRIGGIHEARVAGCIVRRHWHAHALPRCCCFVVCLSIVHFYRLSSAPREKNRVHHDEIHDTTVWPKDCFGDIILQFSQL
jgi:hypothetical protein